MTDQEAFNRVVLHLTQQGCKSQGENRDCLYRGPGGTRCAIGALIPDAEYQPWFDSPDFFAGNSGFESIVQVCPSLQGVTVRLLEDLLEVHDRYDVALWPERLRIVASRYDLSTDVLNG